MQLNIRDLSRLLNADESTITRWIKQRGLPTQRIGGQYRVHRADLLEWATANNIRVSLELFDQLDSNGESGPSLCEALAAGGIHYDLPGSSRDQVLRALVDVLPWPEAMDRQMLLQLFLAREAVVSTGVGEGIAIPHVRSPIVLHVPRPTITLAFLARPVDYGAFDGQPVQVLFSIISPTTRGHTQLLSRLAFALHDSRFRETMMRRPPAEEIMEAFRQVEAAMKTAAK
jgi:PTS system nitrogen regulatory IIA component